MILSTTVLITAVRSLAKSPYWQAVYSFSKEQGCNMFDNQRDFTNLQITFINYLEFYASLHMDVAMNEITDIIFEDEIYEDAYAYYRRHKKEKADKKPAPENQNSWVFTRPVKKK